MVINSTVSLVLVFSVLSFRQITSLIFLNSISCRHCLYIFYTTFFKELLKNSVPNLFLTLLLFPLYCAFNRITSYKFIHCLMGHRASLKLEQFNRAKIWIAKQRNLHRLVSKKSRFVPLIFRLGRVELAIQLLTNASTRFITQTTRLLIVYLDMVAQIFLKHAVLTLTQDVYIFLLFIIHLINSITYPCYTFLKI